MSKSTPQRDALIAPHRAEHEASVAAAFDKGAPPRGLASLVVWYREAWDAEIPSRTHIHELWHEDGMGSALGAPAWADPFRRYLEHSPRERDEDGYYLRPVHAALSLMDRRKPLLARLLIRFAWCGFSVETLQPDDATALPLEYRLALVEWGLADLWSRWEPAPRSRAA